MVYAKSTARLSQTRSSVGGPALEAVKIGPEAPSCCPPRRCAPASFRHPLANSDADRFRAGLCGACTCWWRALGKLCRCIWCCLPCTSCCCPHWRGCGAHSVAVEQEPEPASEPVARIYDKQVRARSPRRLYPAPRLTIAP